MSQAITSITPQEAEKGPDHVRRSAVVKMLLAHGFAGMDPGRYIFQRAAVEEGEGYDRVRLSAEGLDPYVPNDAVKTAGKLCVKVARAEEQKRAATQNSQAEIIRRMLPGIQMPAGILVEPSERQFILRSSEHPEIGIAIGHHQSQAAVDSAIASLGQSLISHRQRLRDLEKKYGYVIVVQHGSETRLVNPSYDLPDVVLPRYQDNDSFTAMEERLAEADRRGWAFQDEILEVFQECQDSGMSVVETEEGGVRSITFTGSVMEASRNVLPAAKQDVAQLRLLGTLLKRLTPQGFEAMKEHMQSGEINTHGAKQRSHVDPEKLAPANQAYQGLSLLEVRQRGQLFLDFANVVEKAQAQSKKAASDTTTVAAVIDSELRAPVISKAALEKLRKYVGAVRATTKQTLLMYSTTGQIAVEKDAAHNVHYTHAATGDTRVVPADANESVASRIVYTFIMSNQRLTVENQRLNTILQNLGVNGIKDDYETYVDAGTNHLRLEHTDFGNTGIFNEEVETSAKLVSGELLTVKMNAAQFFISLMEDRLVSNHDFQVTGDDTEHKTFTHQPTGKQITFPKLDIKVENSAEIVKAYKSAIEIAQLHTSTANIATLKDSLVTRFGCRLERNKLIPPFPPGASSIRSASVATTGNAATLGHSEREIERLLEEMEQCLTKQRALVEKLRGKGLRVESDAQAGKMTVTDTKGQAGKTYSTYGSEGLLAPIDAKIIEKAAGLNTHADAARPPHGPRHRPRR